MSIKRLLHLLLMPLLFSVAFATQAASYCVGPAATGSGSGENWSNLKAWSSTPARGDVWYLTTGTYASKVFNTPASGTTLITIKKATVADHLTSVGWSDSMAAQAVLGAWSITSSYWVFDGQTGDGFSVSPGDETPSRYGFYLSNGTFPIRMGNGASGVNFTDITIKHCYAKATSSDTPKGFFSSGNLGSHVDNVTISYCLLDGWQVGYWCQQGSTWNGCLWEYNIYINPYSSSANHGTCFDPDSSSLTGLVCRYSLFRGPVSGGSGLTCIVEANNANLSNSQIYGCVFDQCLTGRAIIGGTSAGKLSTTLVYHNTFLNSGNSSGGLIDGVGGTGNMFYNNLVYNAPATIGSGVTHDYNTYISCSSVSSEANSQIGSGNPFVNSSSYNYRLVANTTAGTVLGDPFNVDPLGNLRATSTRGAFEYGILNTNPAISISPTSLGFGAVVTNTSRYLTIVVRNNGGGILAGSATFSGLSPFTVVSNGTYSLGANQSQPVTVRFNPLLDISYSTNITFTGGNGATATVSGTGIRVSANTPPAVSTIVQNAADIDPVAPGIQIFEGSVVQYSGSASDSDGDPLTWQWVYTVNGGAEIVYRSGSGTVTPVSFSYGTGAAGRTYVWKLRVSDSVATGESQLTNAVVSPPVVGGGLSFEAESGVISAPFVISGGAVSQLSTSDLASGGRAVYSFTVTNAGDYVIRVLVNAPSLTGNSIYLNIDAEPQDPAMAWDILPPTSGFESRLACWRGNGTADANEFVPKFFNLTLGTHQLIIRGREASTQLDSFAILKVPRPPQGLRVVANP